MTRRTLAAVFSSRPELRPARALLSPTWLGALAVLGVNDHLLKGAGILPGGLTGKLSDFAGMIVAPALLAALLGVRSGRGLLHCHIAVGLVFALINLSPACADAWSWLMGLVGFPWTITVDPTDLVALPALALGWRVLVPAMRPAARPVPSVSLSRWPSRPEFGAAALGSLLCVATSDTGDDEGGWDTEGDLLYQDFQGDVYLHNSDIDRELVVRVRDLREGVEIDCFNAQGKPGVLFSDALFGEGQTWSIPPGANVPARGDLDRVSRDCYAVLVTSDTIEPTVLFWNSGDIGLDWIPGQHADSGEYLAGAVILTADEDGRATITDSRQPIVFPQRDPADDAYIPGDDAGRVAWSKPPIGVHRIADLALGSDGCAAFDLDAGLPRFYFCSPLTELPFAAGQYLSVVDQGDRVLLERAPDPGDPTPFGPVEVVASRGNHLVTISGATLAAKPEFDVELGPELTCGTVAQPQTFSASFGGQIVQFRPGETVELDDGASHLVLHGVHAERRIILAPDCAEGPDALGDDLELVYVRTASQQQP